MFEEQIRELKKQLTKSYQFFTDKKIKIYTFNGVYSNPGVHYTIYSKSETSELNNWNQLCNGLVTNSENKTCSIPPFHPWALQKEQRLNKEYDLVQVPIGKIVNVFFDKEQMMVNDHCCFYPRTSNEFTQINKLKWKNYENHNFTFVLGENEITLISVRFLGNYRDMAESDVGFWAKNLGALRPTIWEHIKNVNHAYEIMKDEFNYDYFLRGRINLERFMPYTETGLKLRNSCLKTFKRIVTLWLHDQHIEASFKYPLIKGKISIIESKVEDTIEFVKSRLMEWEDKLDLQKSELIKKLNESKEPKWVHKFILKIGGIARREWYNLILARLKKLTPRTFMQAIKLSE